METKDHKYNKYDKVFFIHDNKKIIEGTVASYRVTASDEPTYDVIYKKPNSTNGSFTINKNESEIFSSKEDLIESL